MGKYKKNVDPSPVKIPDKNKRNLRLIDSMLIN